MYVLHLALKKNIRALQKSKICGETRFAVFIFFSFNGHNIHKFQTYSPADLTLSLYVQ